MTIEMYPTEFEGTDEIGNAVFKVVCFDEFTSEIKINTLVTPETWAEIAVKVAEALRMIHPKEQDEKTSSSVS